MFTPLVLSSQLDFPAQPELFDDLSTLVADAWAAEGDIVRALADPNTSAQLLSEITVKV